MSVTGISISGNQDENSMGFNASNEFICFYYRNNTGAE
ncbi:hypothetical protein C942_04585 [Photobacterium marinum]|uniref:Uncharacterized protein n=1 Tax=Photobacterium marinum TaxID=1056511 RepID=L8JDG2_9GAMM|nr:hypothetical protein C942_04585 [Photobacterium marinum]